MKVSLNDKKAIGVSGFMLVSIAVYLVVSYATMG